MASVKCSREQLRIFCRDWIIKLETRSPRQTCGRLRFPSARLKRIAKFISPTEQQFAHHIAETLINKLVRTSLNGLFTAHYTISAIVAMDRSKDLLSALNKSRRFQIAKGVQGLDNDWKIVKLANESPFQHHAGDRLRVWRKNEKKSETSPYICYNSFQANGGNSLKSVMLFLALQRIPLTRVEECLIAQKHFSINLLFNGVLCRGGLYSAEHAPCQATKHDQHSLGQYVINNDTATIVVGFFDTATQTCGDRGTSNDKTAYRSDRAQFGWIHVWRYQEDSSGLRIVGRLEVGSTLVEVTLVLQGILCSGMYSKVLLSPRKVSQGHRRAKISSQEPLFGIKWRTSVDHGFSGYLQPCLEEMFETKLSGTLVGEDYENARESVLYQFRNPVFFKQKASQRTFSLQANTLVLGLDINRLYSYKLMKYPARFNIPEENQKPFILESQEPLIWFDVADNHQVHDNNMFCLHRRFNIPEENQKPCILESQEPLIWFDVADNHQVHDNNTSCPHGLSSE
ncbi:hypothetical protein TNCV_533031 [Trichonephila clavipes]|nr:hypothetical protein TNCV_533031 [Trichonephila clavipes]